MNPEGWWRWPVLVLIVISAQVHAQEITPYGSLRLALQNLDSDENDDDALDIEDRFSRLGLTGTIDLTETTMLSGWIEYGLAESGELEQGGDTALRLAFLEFDGPLGNLRIGSQDLLWHRYVRGAYMSDALDSLRHGAIRDDDLVQYNYRFDRIRVGAELSFEGEDGEDINQGTAAIEYRDENYRLQAAIMRDNLGENTGTLAGVRGWIYSGQWAWSAFYHHSTDDFDLYFVSGGNVGAETASCGGEERDTAGIYGRYRSGQHQYHARIADFDCASDSAEQSYKFEYIYYLAEQARLWASFEQISSASGVPEPSIGEIGFRFDF